MHTALCFRYYIVHSNADAEVRSIADKLIISPTSMVSSSVAKSYSEFKYDNDHRKQALREYANSKNVEVIFLSLT